MHICTSFYLIFLFSIKNNYCFTMNKKFTTFKSLSMENLLIKKNFNFTKISKLKYEVGCSIFCFKDKYCNSFLFVKKICFLLQDMMIYNNMNYSFLKNLCKYMQFKKMFSTIFLFSKKK